ncbi:uncharacterized protein LOC113852486 [Abrus precatorius]|uniref:Uncharacterized protein LOC113852486 n=1 Tax=Abrus precatorius TaxID=3816 RepID=A0A8B8K4J5_ABRPR|nr:uncharacterized protein LOC113852486 [Abrus precatorius]
MLSQMHLHSPRPFSLNKFPIAATTRSPFFFRVRSSTTSPPVGDSIPAPVISEQQTLNSSPPTQSIVTAASPSPIAVSRNLGFRPTPELGLLSHLFVLSMAFGAFFSVVVVSIPTLVAFGRLGASVKKLSKVVSEEVPGTLSSLKLSSMELNELTQQLSSLRHKIGGVRIGKKDESTARSRSFRKKNPGS